MCAYCGRRRGVVVVVVPCLVGLEVNAGRCNS